jgi:hypothetical protein
MLWVLREAGTSPPSFSTIVGVIFPILTIVAGGVAILAYGSNKVLRETADDLRKRVSDLEHEREVDRQKIASQDAELKVWQRAVTGEVQLAAILDLLGDHHKEAVAEWAKNRVAEGNMVQAMNRLAQKIDDRMG